MDGKSWEGVVEKLDFHNKTILSPATEENIRV